MFLNVVEKKYLVTGRFSIKILLHMKNQILTVIMRMEVNNYFSYISKVVQIFI